MDKKLGIIGAVVMVAAVTLGVFFNFPGEIIVEIAGIAFALCLTIKSAVDKAKEEGSFSWKTVLIIALAVSAGVLCCLGGYNQNIFLEISGAVIALLTVIFGSKIKK